jgi:hypothetical protein
LGQKQTYAVQHGMSALAPKANATDGMSALGQKWTSRHSLDHFVGTRLQLT